jgi:hypothetical protein
LWRLVERSFDADSFPDVTSARNKRNKLNNREKQYGGGFCPQRNPTTLRNLEREIWMQNERLEGYRYFEIATTG